MREQLCGPSCQLRLTHNTRNCTTPCSYCLWHFPLIQPHSQWATTTASKPLLGWGRYTLPHSHHTPASFQYCPGSTAENAHEQVKHRVKQTNRPFAHLIFLLISVTQTPLGAHCSKFKLLLNQALQNHLLLALLKLYCQCHGFWIIHNINSTSFCNYHFFH